MKMFLERLKQFGLKPGHNWQKELTSLVKEIANRDGVTEKEVAFAPEIEAVLEQPKLTAPQKLAKIKEILQAMRYPIYAKAKKSFAAELKALGLNGRIKVKPAPFFEDNKVTVEFSYSSPSDLEEVIKLLERLKEVDLVKNALKAAEDNC